jgi:hypothetical protein
VYARETWSLTLSEEYRLEVYENRMLRRIFGPKRDEVIGWGNLHNEELHNLYSSPNLSSSIYIYKSESMRLAGRTCLFVCMLLGSGGLLLCSGGVFFGVGQRHNNGVAFSSKSKSHYDRRPVGQCVLVSSPVWGSWTDIYRVTVTVLSISGAPSDERSGLPTHHVSRSWDCSTATSGIYGGWNFSTTRRSPRTYWNDWA